MRYYLERRDATFEHKILVVYREIALELTARETTETRPLYTVSVDEQPGGRALATTAPDLPPVPGVPPCLSRDHEHVPYGTVSIIAPVDWHDGHLIAQVCDRHRGRECIGLLREWDAY